jgi:autotransporter-associated beta strand protein
MTKIIPPTGTTRLWDGGGTDDNWMTPNNWNPNGMPQEGDDLVFPTVAQRKDNLNNYPAGTTFNSITVHGSNYNIGGNRITLNQKLDFTSPNGSPTWSADLTLALDVTLSITGTTFLQTDSLIDTNGHDLILHNATALGGDVYLSGTISGSGGVRKTGPGAITFFDWPHTYTGPTSVEAGTLALSYQATLGGAQSGTTVAAGATLQFRNSQDPMTCSENITLYGRLMDTGGQTLQINGSLFAAADTATIESSDNGMFLNGAISGAVLHKAGTGGITIAGMTANTLSGGMFVDAGELRLQKAVGNALDCPVIIGNAGVAAKVTLAAPNQLNDNGTVQIVHPSGVLDIGAHSDTIASLVMNGGTLTGTAAGRLTLQTLAVNANDATAVVAAPIVRAAAGGVLQVANGNASPDLRFDSVVYGTAFEKQGEGRMDLMASIPVEGLDLLKITSGSALFFANCRYTNVELAGGTVGGQGVAGNITALSGGTVSPGTDSSAGGLGGYAGSWNAGTTMRVELNGLNPGSEFDQYASFGALTLGGSKLALTAGFTPAPGDSFMIVRNVSGAAIGGTFAGIPEGGYVSAPGAKVFQVTYKGGDGDDVVLTSVDVAPPVLVSHGMTPGTGPHEGENDTHMTVKGTPGLAYQLEFSTDLTNWTAGDSKVADLQTGLMEFEFYNNENDPRLYLRVRLP